MAACGDLGDARLPLSLDLPERPPPLPPAQAVAKIDIYGTPSTACPLDVVLLLPAASAVDTLKGGRGQRLIDGKDATVACDLEALDGPALTFKVNLHIEHARLPMFSMNGEQREDAAWLALQLTTPNGDPLQTRCLTRLGSIDEHGIGLVTETCEPASGHAELGRCTLEVSALFENCRGAPAGRPGSFPRAAPR